MKANKKTILLILFLSSFALRLVFISSGRFLFSWDFGRDLLWLRQLVIQKKPILVGPWGSLDNSFFGPFYYYLMAGPLAVFGLKPKVAVSIIAGLLSLMPVIGYGWAKNHFSRPTALIFGLGLAGLRIFVNLSLYAFSQNLIPLVYLFFIIGQWRLINKPSLKTIFPAGLLAGLLFSFEPVDVPPAIVVLLLLLVWLKKKARLTNIFPALAGLASGLIIPFLPNLAFDCRHQFKQFQALQGFIAGSDQSLHGRLPLTSRLIDRANHFLNFLAKTFFGQARPVFLASSIILLGLTTWQFIVYKLKNQSKNPPACQPAKQDKNNCIDNNNLTSQRPNNNTYLAIKLAVVNLLVLFTYCWLFPPLLKTYYLYMLPVLYWLLFSLALGWLIQTKKISLSLLVSTILLLVIVNSYQLVKQNYLKITSETFAVQKAVVDQVYQQAKGQAFKVYAYLPSVYDYAYQQLFSHYGYQTYGYIPADYAYLPGQPDYVLNKELFDQAKPTKTEEGQSANQVFLIINPENHLSYKKEDWLNRFSHLKAVEEKLIYGQVKLVHCQN